MKLLIVKTSSMGDVVHALPVVADIHAALAGVSVHWLVEPAFAALPGFNPQVARVWSLPWRRWRRRLGERATWRAMGELRGALRAERFDLVLDLQGLVKSACWARQAGALTAGFDAGSAREPLAATLYGRRAPVARRMQAVARCRALAAAHLDYRVPDSAPAFGLRVAQPTTWRPNAPGRWAVLIPGASRPEKLWPEDDWAAVGRRLADGGATPVVLWGSPLEQATAARIAAACGGEVPPLLSVGDAVGLLAEAAQVVGLDTGFTHAAAALGRPTVGIYCDHDPGLAGLAGAGPLASLGGKGQRPTRGAVLQAIDAAGFAPAGDAVRVSSE